MLSGQSSEFLTIQGNVRDICGDNIGWGKVSIASNQQYIKQIKISNSGYFRIDSLKAQSEIIIRVRAEGYFDKNFHFIIKNDTILNIKLRPFSQSCHINPYIQFPFNQSIIATGFADSLSILIRTINENPKLIIGIIGYTDSLETPDIVEERMENTLQFLISLGADSIRLKKVRSEVPARTEGIETEYYDCETKRFIYGKLITEKYIKEFKTKNQQEKFRSFNRRVIFKIIGHL